MDPFDVHVVSIAEPGSANFRPAAEIADRLREIGTADVVLIHGYNSPMMLAFAEWEPLIRALPESAGHVVFLHWPGMRHWYEFYWARRRAALAAEHISRSPLLGAHTKVITHSLGAAVAIEAKRYYRALLTLGAAVPRNSSRSNPVIHSAWSPRDPVLQFAYRAERLVHLDFAAAMGATKRAPYALPRRFRSVRSHGAWLSDAAVLRWVRAFVLA